MVLFLLRGTHVKDKFQASCTQGIVAFIRFFTVDLDFPMELTDVLEDLTRAIHQAINVSSDFLVSTISDILSTH